MADEKPTEQPAAGAAPAAEAEAAPTAAAPDPATEPKAEEPAVSPLQDLWKAAQASSHPEIWGVTLADPDSHVPSQIVFQKYLNANDGDVTKAKEQLNKTLEWRAKVQPLELVKKTFSSAKFGGLGYVTHFGADDKSDPEQREVFTWNIYGGVKDINETFGSLEEPGGFLEWRAALMEMGVQELSLSTATKPITAEHDPYKMFQVHDYKSISFFRQSEQVKAASSKTIEVFGTAYPELLKEKFFVNVPAIMGFMYGVMKLFVAPKTLKKFHPMRNGGDLAQQLTESKVDKLGEKLPAEYGGKGEDLKTQGVETALE